MALSRRAPSLLQQLCSANSVSGMEFSIRHVGINLSSASSAVHAVNNLTDLACTCFSFSSQQRGSRSTATSSCHQEEQGGALPCGEGEKQRCHSTKQRWSHVLQRGFSSIPPPDDSALRQDPPGQDESTFCYKGPLSQAVKNLKKLSIAGCAASVVGGPILVLGSGDAMPVAAQASIIFTVASFGVFTTSLLHWFTSPYVHTLEYDRRTGQVRAETLNILGQPRFTAFHESKAAYPNTMRPQVTFEVDNKHYFLDENYFSDKELLARLSPPDPSQTAVQELPGHRSEH